MDPSALKSPSQADFTKTVTSGAAAIIQPDVVKRLKRKADFILLPMLTFAYLLKYVRLLLPYCLLDINYQLMINSYDSSLDRSNVSNAYTAGLSADLGLKGNQYNQLLIYYQIPFIVLGPVATMFTKMLGARWTLPGMLLLFGAASLASGFAKNFKSMVVCRVFVGAFESGFLASCVLIFLGYFQRVVSDVSPASYTTCQSGTPAKN